MKIESLIQLKEVLTVSAEYFYTLMGEHSPRNLDKLLLLYGILTMLERLEVMHDAL
jgi:hypothetical protein